MYEETFKNIEKIKKNSHPLTLQFMERIGATIMGIKPAEILNMEIKDFKQISWECRPLKNIKMRLIKDNGARQLILIYHPQCLKNVLQNTENLSFLQKLTYPQKFSLHDYLEYLILRLQKDFSAHEIGIFLGYPLKDVYGYMGLTQISYKKTKGWKMYGDTHISEQYYDNYHNGRTNMRNILGNPLN